MLNGAGAISVIYKRPMITEATLKPRMMLALMCVVVLLIGYLVALQFYRLLNARREAVDRQELRRIENEIRFHLRWYKELALISGAVYVIFSVLPWVANHL